MDEVVVCEDFGDEFGDGGLGREVCGVYCAFSTEGFDFGFGFGVGGVSLCPILAAVWYISRH